MASRIKKRRITSNLNDVITSINLQSDRCEILMDSLLKLKNMLTSKEIVENLISDKKQTYCQILNMTKNISSNLFAEDPSTKRENDKIITKISVLRECLSILANCCHFTITACLELKNSSQDIIKLIAQFLSSDQSNFLPLKACSLRLISNLSLYKEYSCTLVQNKNLLDSICFSCSNSSTSVKNNAIRVLKSLSSPSYETGTGPFFLSSILASDGAYFLGLIVRENRLKNDDQFPIVVNILLKLAKFRPMETGKQLARSECASSILNCALENKSNNIIMNNDNNNNNNNNNDMADLLLELNLNSFEMRESFAIIGTIDQLTLFYDNRRNDNDNWPSLTRKLACKILASFGQDAFGRASLRTSGALDRLVDRFAACVDDVDEQLMLMTTFKQFAYDTYGMAHLAGNEQLIATFVDHLRRYLTTRRGGCGFGMDSDEGESDDEEMDSDQDMTGLDMDADADKERPIDKERPMNGECAMKETDCEICNDEECPLKVDANGDQLDSKDNSVDSNDDYRPDSPFLMALMEQQRHQQRRQGILPSPLLYKDFSCLSPGHRLVTPCMSTSSDISSASLSPLSSANLSPLSSSSVLDEILDRTDDRCTRLKHIGQLKPVNRHDQLIAIELFLLAWFSHTDETLSKLARIDLIDRLIAYCVTMANDGQSKAGRVLRRLARSIFDMETLLSIEFHGRIVQNLCRTECILKRRAQICINCESTFNFGRELLVDFSINVDSDFGTGLLARNLNKSDEEKRILSAIAAVVLVKSTYRRTRLLKDSKAFELLLTTLQYSLTKTDEKSLDLSVKIVNSLAELVQIDRLHFLRQTSVHLQVAAARCNLPPPDTCDCVDYLFDDGRKTTVDKQTIRHKSDYFRTMFDGHFVERHRRQFHFCRLVERCSDADFRRFLHLLSNCTADCANVKSAQSCLSLIVLSDRYLCSNLLSFLVETTASVHISGRQLAHFLMTAHSITENVRLFDICIATLFHNANRRQLQGVFSIYLRKNDFVHTFIAHLRRFLLHFGNI